MVCKCFQCIKSKKDLSNVGLFRLCGLTRMAIGSCTQSLLPSKVFIFFQPFPKQALVFTSLQYKSLENTVGKREIACNEQFLLFSQCFLPMWRISYHFHQIQNCRLQTLSVLKILKFVVWERVKVGNFNSSEKIRDF